MICWIGFVVCAAIFVLPVSYGRALSAQISFVPLVLIVTSALAFINCVLSHRTLLVRETSFAWLLIFLGYIALQYAGSYFNWPIQSVYAYATREEFVRLFVWFLTSQLIVTYASGHRRFIWFLIFCVILAGYLVSLLNLYELFRSNLPLNWLRTHPNRNNVAAFLELIGPVALGVAAYRYQLVKSPSAAKGENFILRLLVSDSWFLLAVSANFVIIAGAFASLSKMSVLTLPVSYILFFFFSRSRNFRGRHIFWFLMIVTLVIVFGYFVAGNLFAYRLNQAKAFDWQTLDMRIPFWERALPLANHFLWFGSGLGTFSESFVSFHRVSLNFFSKHVLNDYLELMIETGLVGVAIYVMFWLYFFRRFWAHISGEQSFFRRYLPAGILCGLISSLIRQMLMTHFYDSTHSFYLFLLIALTTSIQKEEAARDEILRRPKLSSFGVWIRRVLFSTMFLLCVWSFSRRQMALVFLGKNPIEMSYKRAFSIDADNSEYPSALAKLYRNKSLSLVDEARRVQKLNESRMRLEQAIELNPYNLNYRMVSSEIALQLRDEESGDSVLGALTEWLPFDYEACLARGLYWRKAALLAGEGFQRDERLRRASSFLEGVRSSNPVQDQHFQSVKEKRLSALQVTAN